ncbi:protein ZNRD2 [Pocillopora verrucosa]|uniref:protein ZNRD2 n=1 Tax=Pocillopora verrucosa TaxID=203993 RepID=UPI00334098F4
MSRPTMDKHTQERINRTRERSDKISALMGQYLLKGYRMLGSTCDVCGNVLLKYRDQSDYCVACQEVDAQPTDPSDQGGLPVVQPPQQDSHETSRVPSNPVDSSVNKNAVAIATQAVNAKIVWASEALSRCHFIGECQQLCELLKTCAETLKVLKEIQ